MSRVKITDGPWKGQEGEYVRDDEESGRAVVRMPGDRLVEFAPEIVDTVIDAEPEPDDK